MQFHSWLIKTSYGRGRVTPSRCHGNNLPALFSISSSIIILIVSDAVLPNSPKYMFYFQKKKSGVSNPAHGPGSRVADHPPSTNLVKTQYSSVSPNIRKDKRQNSSRFNISQNRELQKLPLLKGNIALVSIHSLAKRQSVSTQPVCEVW